MRKHAKAGVLALLLVIAVFDSYTGYGAPERVLRRDCLGHRLGVQQSRNARNIEIRRSDGTKVKLSRLESS